MVAMLWRGGRAQRKCRLANRCHVEDERPSVLFEPTADLGVRGKCRHFTVQVLLARGEGNAQRRGWGPEKSKIRIHRNEGPAAGSRGERVQNAGQVRVVRITNADDICRLIEPVSEEESLVCFGEKVVGRCIFIPSFPPF